MTQGNLEARIKRLEDIEDLKRVDVDILDIGRQIVDAPLLDIRLEVTATEQDPAR